METFQKSLSSNDVVIEEKRQSVASSKTLDQALSTLNISTEDADEAFAYLQNHPNADHVRQEALAILEDPRALRKLVWKIDLIIIPCLIFTYFLQFLDKTTINYASIMGMRQDTHLKGQDYSNVAMMFYIGFLAAEFPGQFLSQHIGRLGQFLGVCIMLWGVSLACMAAVQNYAGLMVLRTILGIFESPVAPTLVLICSMWYKKAEQGSRISYFYVCNALTQIVGSLVAYGVSFTTNKKIAPWRVFFLAIGLLTIVLGLYVFLVLPNSIVQSKISDAEKIAALLRVKENQTGTQNKKIKRDQIWAACKDVRIWLIALSVMLTSIPNGGLSNFSAILLTTFGYTPRQALLYSAPGGAVGVLIVLFTGWLSDRLRDRSTVMLICLLPTIAAAAMMYGLDPTGHPKPHSKGWLLFASYLSGTFGAAFLVILAWNASNLAGHSKKVFVNALTLVSFALGNILGTQTFQAKQAPGYNSGKISIIACLSAQILVVFVLRYCNDRLNKRNQKILSEMSEEDKTIQREKMAYADVNDLDNPFMVYTH